MYTQATKRMAVLLALGPWPLAWPPGGLEFPFPQSKGVCVDWGVGRDGDTLEGGKKARGDSLPVLPRSYSGPRAPGAGGEGVPR